jgi:hypothetical protein
MRKLSQNSRYFILVVTIGVLVLWGIGFKNRLTTLRRLTEESEEVQTHVSMLEATQFVLETQIAYATSPAAVEEWAYEEARMVRPGDHLVAPISPLESTPTPSVVIESPTESLENWQVWMALFFDQSSP